MGSGTSSSSRVASSSLASVADVLDYMEDTPRSLAGSSRSPSLSSLASGETGAQGSCTSSSSRAASPSSMAASRSLSSWQGGRFDGELAAWLRRALLEAEGSAVDEMVESLFTNEEILDFISSEAELEALIPLAMHSALGLV